MVTIKQHGSSGKLFDIACFLADVDRYYQIDSWRFSVETCIGARALEIEQLSADMVTLSDADFRSIYRGIKQTNDGRFIGLEKGVPQFELLAVDSSFWDVSGTTEFESHMLKSYGAYEASGA
jgi:hypothetical protein